MKGGTEEEYKRVGIGTGSPFTLGAQEKSQTACKFESYLFSRMEVTA